MKPSARRVLDCLRAADGAWISGNRIVADGGGWRYSARIHELRAAGYDIERRSVRGSSVDEYKLVEQLQLELAV
jgi:biotin operon repressor